VNMEFFLRASMSFCYRQKCDRIQKIYEKKNTKT